jgi:pyruvate dehydrogenase (quinone)
MGIGESADDPPARSLGLHGVLAEKPEDVVPAWEEALLTDRPCVVEFVTDPAVPPIPPHATWDQIEKAAESIVRGDSDRIGMIVEGFRSKVQEMLPGTKDTPDQVAGDQPGAGRQP